MDLMHRMGTALLIHMPQISSISIRKKHTNNQAIIPKVRNDTTPLSFLLLMLVSVSAKYTAVPTWNKGKIRKSKHWYPPERFFRRHPSSWTETHSIMSIVLTKEKIANGPTVAILFWKVITRTRPRLGRILVLPSQPIRTSDKTWQWVPSGFVRM